MSRTSYRRDIQGLRGLAVVLVVAYHANLPLTGGFIGVDVFFVVSGFVIAAMLMREFASTGRISLGRFYRRRVRRLLPALGVMIGVVAVLSIVLLGPLGQQQLAVNTGIAASAFVGNIYLGNASGGYFDLQGETNPFLHTWSLSVEEQFYLVLPVVLWGLWRIASRGRTDQLGAWPVVVPVAVLAGLSALLVLSPWILLGQGPMAGSSAAFFSSITRGWEFGAGVVLALLAHRLPAMPAVAGKVLVVGGATLVIVGAITISETTPFPGPATLLPVAGATAMIAGGSVTSRSLVGYVLSAPPLVRIGDLSYSWYLWHWPLVVLPRPYGRVRRSQLPLLRFYLLGPQWWPIG